MPDLDYSPALNEDGTEFDIVKAAEIAKGVLPLAPEDIEYWRREVAKGPRGVHDWPDDDVLVVIGRFLATLDAARAPEAELAEALHEIGGEFCSPFGDTDGSGAHPVGMHNSQSAAIFGALAKQQEARK